MKKLLSATSLMLVILLIFPFTAFAAETPEEKYNYVLLGDSIARGAGILNPDEACYGLMVANTNGYNYVNYGVDGFTSGALLARLEADEVINDVKNADIISLSIGGNDFLGSNILGLLFAEVFTQDYSEYNRIRDAFYENFCKIVKKIRTANSDALLLMQTVYNMRHDFFKGVNQRSSDLLNECYRRYLEENPGAYVLVDVAKVLDGRWDCLAADTIHPNGTGNKEIARLVLAAVKQAGMGESTEPVILIEPLEIIDFSPLHPFRVITYYLKYLIKHL